MLNLPSSHSPKRRSSLFLQFLLPQFFPSVVQPRLNGSQRDVERGRDVVNLGVGEELQFDDLPMINRQR